MRFNQGSNEFDSWYESISTPSKSSPTPLHPFDWAKKHNIVLPDGTESENDWYYLENNYPEAFL